MDCYENGFWALDNFSNTYAYEGGQARRYDGQSSTETLTEQYRIAEGQGFVDIGGEPYYASDLPLKENDALFERLKEWISQPLEPGESIPDLRELELLAAKEPDPFASSLSFSNDPEVIGTKGYARSCQKGWRF